MDQHLMNSILNLKTDSMMAFGAIPLETSAVVVTHLVSDR